MYRHLFIVALAAATGQQRWKVDTLPWAPQLNNVPNSKGRAPLVTAASVLYVPFVGPGHPNQGVEVFAPTGRPLQRLLPHVPPDAMVVAPDGICYELGGDTLTALAPAGAVRWQRTSYADTLLIGQHGTVYAAGGDRLVAYSPGGRLLWSREMADQIDTLGERADGTVLAAGSAGLSAVSPTNHLLWHRT